MTKQIEFNLSLFSMEDQSILRELLHKQIRHLYIDIENEKISEENEKASIAFKLI